MFQHGWNVEAIGAMVSAGLIAKCDNLVLRLIQEFGGVGTDVAESLQGDTRLLWLATQMRKKLKREDADAPAGCFLAAFDTIVLDGLAGDAGGIEAVVFFPLIANPGHFTPGGAHVGRGNVLV